MASIIISCHHDDQKKDDALHERRAPSRRREKARRGKKNHVEKRVEGARKIAAKPHNADATVVCCSHLFGDSATSLNRVSFCEAF
jgi:hypothetical protein